MKKIYLPRLLKNISHIPPLYPQLGLLNKESSLFYKNKFSGFDKPFFDIVETVDESDFIIVPHEYTLIKKTDNSYLEMLQEMSKNSGIPLIIYVAGDFDDEICIPNAFVLRASKKTKKLKENEFIIPPLVDDLSPGGAFRTLNKKDIPTIGFCGWADFRDYNLFFRAVIKDLFNGIFNIVKRRSFYGSNRNGVLLRKEILSQLSRSDLIRPNFIVRTSFGQNKKTISVDPERARREFEYNIKESDLSLAIRGYGNYSVRFYEILSAGRVPVFIDTDSPLPLEHIIDYSKIMLRVDYRDIKGLDQIISNFYGNLTEQRFLEMQKEARNVYEKYLSAGSFYELFFREII